DGDRFEQPPVEPAASHAVGNARIVVDAGDPRQAEIIGQSRVRHAAAVQKHPPGDPSLVRAHGPTLAGVEVDEWENRLAEDTDAVLRPDLGDIRPGGPIA